LSAGWSDVGSWDALESILQQNGADNLVVKGEIITIESRDNIVYADKQIVALLGVNDLVVVDSGDTLLIGYKRQMQRVKEIVERLRAQGRSDLL
jgi:mannose-1-phosphate guanylyltransferase